MKKEKATAKKKYVPSTEKEIRAKKISDEKKYDFKCRINRILGQINGVKSMIENSRECGDILVQLSAAISALRSFRFEVIKEHFETNVLPDVLKEEYDGLYDVLEMFKKN